MTTVTQLGGFTNASSLTIPMTVGANVPTGSTVVVLVDTTTAAANPSGVVDSKGNTYVPGTSFNSSGILIRPFWCVGTTVALVNGVDTITATFPVAPTSAMIGAIAVDSTLGLSAQGTGTTAASTSPTATLSGLSGNQILIAVGGIAAAAADTFTEAGGWNSNTPELNTAALRWAWQTSGVASPTYSGAVLGTSRRWYYNLLAFSLPTAGYPAPPPDAGPQEPDRRVAITSQSNLQGRPPPIFAPIRVFPDPNPLRPDPRIGIRSDEWYQGAPPTNFEPPVVQTDWPTPPRPDPRTAIGSQAAQFGRPPGGLTPPVSRRDELPPPRPDNRVQAALSQWGQEGHPPFRFTPPVVQLDWPNPLRPGVYAALESQFRLEGRPPAGFRPPLNQYDWPVPIRPDARAATSAQSGVFGRPPLPSVPPPLQADWPTPGRPPIGAAIDSQARLQGQPPQGFNPPAVQATENPPPRPDPRIFLDLPTFIEDPTLSASITEAATATETLGGVAIGTLTEAAGATDSFAISWTASLTEAATATALLVLVIPLVEAATATDTLTPSVTDAISLVEAASAAETLTPSVTDPETLVEAASAAVTLVPTLLIAAVLTEAASATETLFDLMEAFASLVEPVVATETLTPSEVDDLEILEAANATDGLVVSIAAQITEVANATDTLILVPKGVPAPTRDQLTTLLRAFLLEILPNGLEVFVGQANRVPEPTGDNYIVITPIMLDRLYTTSDSWPTAAGATNMTHLQGVRATVQLDIHGEGSTDNVNMITTVLRSSFGVTFFAGTGIAPLSCDDGIQIGFVSGETQWEDRWVLKPTFEMNIVAVTTQQFADTLTVELGPVGAPLPLKE